MLDLLAAQLEAALAVPEAAVPEAVEVVQLDLSVAVVEAAGGTAEA